ncbi:aspartyl/asparaginyl beta-hydroxylase domain-containing protein [Okeania sp.]|uniref:aspartyl/asparaginyl beta-hydroxylase domain-containing protein n=1 Tax=Okeania sp. TaxID=3100323 RepID=UPI002B4B56CF|nr:aspartyl/asparaginyl beta-hydroxylase domain-containing protein [Okeania sp.]MEB3340633.1 aspartyl/asparaginyl beta-hydroxylase domain-containing protein [Okeania sp.]
MLKLSLENVKAKFREILIYGIGSRLIKFIEQLIPSYSLIGDTAFFESYQFEWVEELEANWMLIRKELDELLKYRDDLPNFQDISPDQAEYTSTDNLWKTYFMYGYGIKSEKNCQRCPETTRLIEKIPGMKTAFFSILMPGKHIPEHRGPYKGVIRCLLGLKIPEPREKCRIRVGNETRYWEEGKGMFFDDSFPHEAWNETDDVRVVLFLDIMRPMGFPLSKINSLLMKIIAISPYIQDAYENQKQWDNRLEKLFSKENEKEKVAS